MQKRETIERKTTKNKEMFILSLIKTTPTRAPNFINRTESSKYDECRHYTHLHTSQSTNKSVNSAQKQQNQVKNYKNIFVAMLVDFLYIVYHAPSNS